MSGAKLGLGVGDAGGLLLLLVGLVTWHMKWLGTVLRLRQHGW